MSFRDQSENLKIKIYKTSILLVVLYYCKTGSRTLREKRRLRLFETGYWGEYLDPVGIQMDKASQWGIS